MTSNKLADAVTKQAMQGKGPLGFEQILHDSVNLNFFKRFCMDEMSVENLLFWLECKEYREIKAPEYRAFSARKIHRKYIADNAPTMLGIEDRLRKAIVVSSAPGPDLFAEAQAATVIAMKLDGDPSSAGVSAFWWVAAIHIVQTVVAQVAFLPRPAVALEAAVTVSATVVKANVGDAPSDGEEECSDSERNIAPSDSPGNDASLPVAGAPTGAVYGALLSMLDLGDTVSGWLTAPLVASLGLTFDDWSNMPALLWTGAGCRLATLALVPLLLVGRNTRRKLARQAQRRSDRLEDSEGGLGATAPLAV